MNQRYEVLGSARIRLITVSRSLAPYIIGGLLSSAGFAATPGEGWISRHNGPSNARRATGTAFGDNWHKVWETAGVGTPLVKNGRVFVQVEPTQTPVFRSIDAASGAVLWTSQPLDSTFVGVSAAQCIAGDRLFVPRSMDGAGAPVTTQRIQCIELTTGAIVPNGSGGPFWDPMITGTVLDLQPVPPSPASGGHDLVACVSEEHPVLPFEWKSRLLCLDAITGQATTSMEVTDSWSSGAPPIVGLATDMTGNSWRAYLHDQESPGHPGGPCKSVALREVGVQGSRPTINPAALVLSGTTLYTLPGSATTCPFIVDPSEQTGYVIETSGRLVAARIETWPTQPSLMELWHVQSTIAPDNYGQPVFVALLPDARRIVATDPQSQTAVNAIAYRTSDGTVAWTTPLPAPPGNWSWCVLDGDVIVLRLADGNIYALYPDGTLSAPIHTDTGPLTNADTIVAAEGRFFVVSGGTITCYEANCDRSIYGTAKANSLGCIPQIGFSGFASVSDPDPFLVTASLVLNQKNGLLFYGYAADNSPYFGGVRWVAPPLHRTPAQSSQGSPLPTIDCSGGYSFNFNARIQSGVDPGLTLGRTVYCQYISRDGLDPFGVGLTDALQFTICP